MPFLIISSGFFSSKTTFFAVTSLYCPCADCADVLAEGHDQQAVWPGGSRAEGGQAEAAGGADSRGRRRRQGENPRVRVSCKAINRSCRDKKDKEVNSRETRKRVKTALYGE